MAAAVLTGSNRSGGGGDREVLTEQNLHPLVHWSPSNWKNIVHGLMEKERDGMRRKRKRERDGERERKGWREREREKEHLNWLTHGYGALHQNKITIF